MVSYPEEVINGQDHLMHAIELGSEVEVYSRNKKREFCHEMSSVAADMY